MDKCVTAHKNSPCPTHKCVIGHERFKFSLVNYYYKKCPCGAGFVCIWENTKWGGCVMSLTKLISSLRLSVTSTAFCYNGTVYQQRFCTAIGSLVSVVVASVVMEHIEDEALNMSPMPTIFWWDPVCSTSGPSWWDVSPHQLYQPEYPVYI